MEIQELLGSDIAMSFDQLVDATLPADQVADAMDRTHRWAERSLSSHGRPDQALFGITQGGVDAQLRRQSVAAIARLPFDGIAIGGLSVGESKAEMGATLEIVADALPSECPSHTMSSTDNSIAGPSAAMSSALAANAPPLGTLSLAK